MDDMELRCKSCGSVLTWDEKERVFRCDYCGVVYDQNESVMLQNLERAFRSMKNEEYSAAIFSFDEYLKYAPQNMVALRGRMLAEGGATYADTIFGNDDRILENVNFDAYIAAAPENQKEYFMLWQQYTVLKRFLRDGSKRLKEVEGKLRWFDNMYGQGKMVSGFFSFFTTKDSKDLPMLIAVIAVGLLLLPMMIIFFPSLIIIAYIGVKANQYKKIKPQWDAYENEKVRLREELPRCQAEFQRVFPRLAEMDRRILGENPRTN